MIRARFLNIQLPYWDRKEEILFREDGRTWIQRDHGWSPLWIPEDLKMTVSWMGLIPEALLERTRRREGKKEDHAVCTPIAKDLERHHAWLQLTE